MKKITTLLIALFFIGGTLSLDAQTKILFFDKTSYTPNTSSGGVDDGDIYEGNNEAFIDEFWYVLLVAGGLLGYKKLKKERISIN